MKCGYRVCLEAAARQAVIRLRAALAPCRPKRKQETFRRPGSKQSVDGEDPIGSPYHALVLVVVALVGVLLLGGLAVFHLLLIAGVPLGRFAWGGQNVVLPARLRIGSAVAVVLYALFAVLMLQAAGAFSVLPDGAADVGIWVLAGFFLLEVVVNAASRSRPERLVMTPVAWRSPPSAWRWPCSDQRLKRPARRLRVPGPRAPRHLPDRPHAPPVLPKGWSSQHHPAP
jgi:hypothetical protein